MIRFFRLFIVSLSLLYAGPIPAHPHVFVDAGVGFDFDADGRLVALRIIWRYDAFTSLTLFDILDLDTDGDGQLNDADRAAIVAGETDWADGYKGDTFMEANSVDIALTRPVSGRSWLSNDQISVAFRLPLADPLILDNSVVLRLYDPSYYYAYDIVSYDDLAPENCLVSLRDFEPDKASSDLQNQLATLSREETPAQPDVGRLFADEVWLTCG
jgi:ABC-type uncharacterized transport system substrate-binding protein